MRRAKISNGIGALLLFASLPAAPALAQQSWQAVGQAGGQTLAVVVQGHYAYVGAGLRLMLVDVSDPAKLREVGATRPFPHFVEDVAVSGTLAYVAAGGAGLRVVDVSNPAVPNELGAWDTRGYANGIAIAGSIAYLADGPYGLRMVDISNPSQPMELGAAYAMHYAFKVAVQGHVAYIAAAGAGLLIADVNDPAHPIEVGSLATNGYAYGVAVAGNTAYVADGWEGVKIVDVAEPARPAQIAAYKTPGWAFGVAVSGSKLYVADAFRGLRVIDVSDPSRPREEAAFEIAWGHAGSVAVAEGVAYVGDRNSGLRTVSLSGGAQLAQLGAYSPLPFADAVAGGGNFAYVAAANAGLRVVDISNPTRAVEIGALPLPSYARSIAVDGPYACLGTMGPFLPAMTGYASLFVVDIRDPAHPSVLGSIAVDGQGQDVKCVDGVAYLATEHGLEIISIADPSHPTRLAFLRTQQRADGPGTSGKVAVVGKTAYVTEQDLGLGIVDVSDPRNPIPRGFFHVASNIRDVAVAGSTAYVADSCLRTVDVSDPVNPVALGSIDLPGDTRGISVAGNFAYLAVGEGGLFVADVSDPRRPALAGTLRMPGHARGVAASGGHVYVANELAGLYIVDSTDASGKVAETWEGSIARHPIRWSADEVKSGGPIDAARTARPRGVPSAVNSCVVTSVADSGKGTLRECLAGAVEGTVITFDSAVFPPSQPATIRPATQLPAISRSDITIDASDAGVILDGGDISGELASGLVIGSDGNTIKGLQILHFTSSGVKIEGSHNVIGGDRGRGRAPTGQGNLISGNGRSGIDINPSPGSGSYNVITGNLIGTDVTGTKALGNGETGVFLPGASYNRIGGLEVAERNVISANARNGVTVLNATGNLIAGNYIGTDITGSVSLGNWRGITLELGAYGNVVQGNVMSGNSAAGIIMNDWGTGYNTLLANRIGTDAGGTRAVPNVGDGLFVGESHARFNRIGGPGPEDRNIISGNGDNGIVINSLGNIVRGNFIGTDVSGQQALGNGQRGVELGGEGAAIVGGVNRGEGNVINSNGTGALGVASDYNFIAGNIVGTDPSGQLALGNRLFAMWSPGFHNVFHINVITHSLGSGIVSLRGSYTTMRRNSIYGNEGPGISYVGAGGDAIPAPVIATVGGLNVSGTACPNCEVEIFSDSKSEGRVFEGSTVADSLGRFTLSTYNFLTGPNVTATATDRDGNTSEFSAAVAAPPRPPRRRAARR